MSMVLDWKPLNAEEAFKQLTGKPLDSPSIDHKPIGLTLEPSLSFGGDAAGKLTLNVRGSLTVAVLNDATDPDEDDILTAAATQTAEGLLPPQLKFDPGRAYLKYRAEAGLKAGGGASIGDFVGFEANAEATAVFADYRVHTRQTLSRDAILGDLAAARFVTNLEHVLALKEGEALAFRFAGALNAAVTVSWSDIFTGQIGTLSKLLGTTAPLAISVKAGATLSLKVRVSDDFLIVFSRSSAARWRLGVRKAKSRRVAPSLDAGIDVGFANPPEIEALAAAALDGVLGAPLEKVKSILSAPSLESLGGVERKVAGALIERLGMNEQLATIQTLRDRVAEARDRVVGVIENVVKTRIALSFAYEYSRVSLDTNLIQATLDEAAVRAFHAAAVKADTGPLAAAIREKRPGIELELYLNQKEITRSRSFGFTLGFGKWATLGGRDFKKISTVRRLDINNRVQDSYLGTRAYTGQFGGSKTTWGVDLKAEMKDYAAEPIVNDFSFGIHLLWEADQKQLSATELEEWLDSAVVWRVVREQDLDVMRETLASALEKGANLSVQMLIPNTVLRSTLPALAVAPVAAFAPALAAGMPWLKVSPARTSAARRRQLYAPLWALYLEDPGRPLSSLMQAAAAHVKKEGHSELVLQESLAQQGPDALSFAGLTQINGDTHGACEAFTRGARILQSAIASGARNQKTIDKAFGEMDDLWTQSHHVRAIGAYLVDAAERAGVLSAVTRTMTVQAAGLDKTVVVTA